MTGRVRDGADGWNPSQNHRIIRRNTEQTFCPQSVGKTWLHDTRYQDVPHIHARPHTPVDARKDALPVSANRRNRNVPPLRGCRGQRNADTVGQPVGNVVGGAEAWLSGEGLPMSVFNRFAGQVMSGNDHLDACPPPPPGSFDRIGREMLKSDLPAMVCGMCRSKR